MKQFLILHYGFIMPTPEDMARWNAWFEELGDRHIDGARFPYGKEITNEGTKDLPFGRDSVTGFTLFEAENLEEATAIAERCPLIDSTRLYEVSRQEAG